MSKGQIIDLPALHRQLQLTPEQAHVLEYHKAAKAARAELEKALNQNKDE